MILLAKSSSLEQDPFSLYDFRNINIISNLRMSSSFFSLDFFCLIHLISGFYILENKVLYYYYCLITIDAKVGMCFCKKFVKV